MSTRSPRLDALAATSADGTPYDVLVLDANTRQSLAVTRSLGRAGLSVVVAECFADSDPRLPVLAASSRFCAASAVFPSYADGSAYGAAVVDFVRRHPVRVVVPAVDGSIEAVLPHREELAALGARVALAPTTTLRRANDKASTLEAAHRLGIETPRTIRIDHPGEIPEVLESLPTPCVLKPVTSWASVSAERLQAVAIADRADAALVLARMLAAGVSVLAQEWIPGRREGVSLFVAEGRLVAAFAHVEWRTTPALGGASVVRESIPVPDDLRERSVALVRALGLDGFAEVEFRRDADGRPLLMEINARMAGMVETAVVSGVDFPLLLWRWASGHAVAPVSPSYRTGIRMRWLRGDMRWLRDNHRSSGALDTVSRWRGLALFGLEFLRSNRYDCFDHTDLKPMLAELRNTWAALTMRARSRPMRAPGLEEQPTGEVRRAS